MDKIYFYPYYFRNYLAECLYVFDRQGILQFERDAIEFQLVRKTLLVCRFEQARPQLSMDRQRAPNDPIRQFIEFHSSCSSVRRAKPGQSSSLRGDCHVNADEPCSCGLSRGGNEAREARPVREWTRAKRRKLRTAKL